MGREDSAAAQVLFEQALDDIAKGKALQGCAKFRRSFELDPKGSTLSNLGVCYDNLHMTASAWGTYQELLVFAMQHKREDLAVRAEQRITALEGKLTRVRLVVAAQPKGFELTRNESRVTDAQWASPLLVDPGEQVFEAHAPGYEPWRRTVKATEPGTTMNVEVPALVPLPQAPPPKVELAPREDRLRVPSIVLMVSGAAGLVAGAVFGGIAQDAYDTAASACDGKVEGGVLRCNASANVPELNRERDAAVRYATVSTLAVLAGGALAITGVTLFVIGASHSTKVSLTSSVLPDHAKLTLGGRF